jgi:hypothetical protein
MSAREVPRDRIQIQDRAACVFPPQKDGAVAMPQLDRIRSYGDYLLLRMANFTTRLRAQSKIIVGWQERAS